MSGKPMGVLSIIDRACGALCTLQGKPPDELMSARNTVAELLEHNRVMRDALVDLREQCRGNLKVGATGLGYWNDALETTEETLARIGDPS